MKLKSKKTTLAIIIFIVAAFWIYILFFAYIPNFIDNFNETSDVISEEAALKECPEIILTDYDREFLDNLLNDPRIRELENSDKYSSLKLIADKDRLERYAPRNDENYTVYADHQTYGILPLSAGIQFEYKGALYRKNLYISVNKGENGNEYVKAVTIQRSDGKYIRSYWYSDGRYKRETQHYGLINHIDIIIDGIMSV